MPRDPVKKETAPPVVEEASKSDVIDWSSPLVSGNETKVDDDDDELKLEWSDDPDSDEDDLDQVPKKVQCVLVFSVTRSRVAGNDTGLLTKKLLYKVLST